MAKTILIVEDDPSSMKLTSDLLGILGYASIKATDGGRGRHRSPGQTRPYPYGHYDALGWTVMPRLMPSKPTPRPKNIPVVMLTGRRL